jgi:UDP-2,3-diacylglucosamine pyrophosphatase LpxH
LLVLSDVHLGSDLNDLTLPEERIHRAVDIDADFVRLLAHYQRTPAPDGRWRLVVAGDFVDFIGITLRTSGESLATPLNEEEESYGLGNAEDHARIKLRRVAARHEDVFSALAAFVGAGNARTFVHGNHDLEFHWPGVQAEMRALLLARATVQGIDTASFDARVTFNPWFFFVDGVAYIEHGHQYDEYCSTEHLMAPLSPLDPRRIARGFCDVLLRRVVRPTRGLLEHGHETMGIVDYLAFGARLGLKGMLQLGARFFGAVVELFRLRRQHFAEARTALKEEHERRVALLAEATRIGVDRLRSLAALQVPPVTRSIRGILASVLLDRLALGLFCSLAMIVAGILAAQRGHAAWLVPMSIVVGWGLAHRALTRARSIDPREVLADRAAHLAKLFPVAFVVMGHTHVPQQVAVSTAAQYINVGGWAEEEPPAGMPRARAPRTHLVIHRGEAGPVANLLEWDPEASAPRVFEKG